MIWNKANVLRAVTGAVLAASLSTGAVAAEFCNNGKSLTAFHVRQLQTDLMVAGLSCQAEGQYNAFIERFNNVLTANGKTLKAHFNKRFGDKAKKRLNAYVTTLANMSSIDSLSAGAGYCENQAAAFGEIMRIAPADLENFAIEWWDSSRSLPKADCRSAVDIATLP